MLRSHCRTPNAWLLAALHNCSVGLLDNRVMVLQETMHCGYDTDKCSAKPVSSSTILGGELDGEVANLFRYKRSFMKKHGMHLA